MVLVFFSKTKNDLSTLAFRSIQPILTALVSKAFQTLSGPRGRFTFEWYLQNSINDQRHRVHCFCCICWTVDDYIAMMRSLLRCFLNASLTIKYSLSPLEVQNCNRDRYRASDTFVQLSVHMYILRTFVNPGQINARNKKRTKLDVTYVHFGGQRFHLWTMFALMRKSSWNEANYPPRTPVTSFRLSLHELKSLPTSRARTNRSN